ncbi:hypothetical protein [Pseudoclavibacter terrae]|uniref:hypothetical protein n=1 Tax=Pseudoclavibacter terrae TaxID=1530195 RepID=UPI00232F8717|nr:hypothetical protein [Pseudoclavibacter terrae]
MPTTERFAGLVEAELADEPFQLGLARAGFEVAFGPQEDPSRMKAIGQQIGLKPELSKSVLIGLWTAGGASGQWIQARAEVRYGVVSLLTASPIGSSFRFGVLAFPLNGISSSLPQRTRPVQAHHGWATADPCDRLQSRTHPRRRDDHHCD